MMVMMMMMITVIIIEIDIPDLTATSMIPLMKPVSNRSLILKYLVPPRTLMISRGTLIPQTPKRSFSIFSTGVSIPNCAY